MTSPIGMYWFPDDLQWGENALTAANAPEPWEHLVKLSKFRLDTLRTNRLERILDKATRADHRITVNKTVKLAVLSSSTIDHLKPGIRIGGLRRGILVEIFVGGYGQYLQEMLERNSELYRFAPDIVVLSFEAGHLFGGADSRMTSIDAQSLLAEQDDRIRNIWRIARTQLKAQVIQQTLLPTGAKVAGENEQRVPGSLVELVSAMNRRLRSMADAEGVDLLAVDDWALRSGIDAWHNPVLWHRAKQEISPSAAPFYGDLVARLIAARRGFSYKCLVLDLDNTLWGGVVGDDGPEGIKIGQGSALGEAHLAFQRYCRDLSRRGIILAVCSKNDEANARAPFEANPEMLLRISDFACFIANWRDKPSNIREIAQRLNIGIDSIVFADDNPFEREIVRRELPMVAVPELPEDPALYAACLADAGYFEAAEITKEDLARSGQYQSNLQRQHTLASSTDLPGYLKTLNMQLMWAPFDMLGMQRIVQLINKTNQFNLTTRRYTETDVCRFMADSSCITLQFRLSDIHGDNGMISVILAFVGLDGVLLVDTWLMSCRVLGRQVEEATMNVLAQVAKARGIKRIVGEYIPSSKNGMVERHYSKLGFRPAAVQLAGVFQWELNLSDFTPSSTFINIQETYRSDTETSL